MELKAKQNLSPQDLQPLLAVPEENKLKRYLYVAFEPRCRKLAGVTMLPFRQFLGALWTEKYA